MWHSTEHPRVFAFPLRHVLRASMLHVHLQKLRRKESSEPNPNSGPFFSFLLFLDEHHGATAWRRREIFPIYIFDSFNICTLHSKTLFRFCGTFLLKVVLLIVPMGTTMGGWKDGMGYLAFMDFLGRKAGLSLRCK